MLDSLTAEHPGRKGGRRKYRAERGRQQGPRGEERQKVQTNQVGAAPPSKSGQQLPHPSPGTSQGVNAQRQSPCDGFIRKQGCVVLPSLSPTSPVHQPTPPHRPATCLAQHPATLPDPMDGPRLGPSHPAPGTCLQPICLQVNSKEEQ